MRDNNVDFDGLHLVESIRDDKFVKYVEELENDRQTNSGDEEISSEDEEMSFSRKNFESVKLYKGSLALLRRMKKSKRMEIDYNLLRILSSLAFLPPDYIIPTFQKVKTKYCKASNRAFFTYFENFWIKKIRPAGFSIYGRDQTTNNVAESFHSLITNFIGVLANATASSKLWELLDQLIKIYHKMEIQLSTYSQKNFMGIIGTKSKKKSLICKNRLNALYSRMRNNNIDFDGLDLVETIHDSKFVKYVEEIEEERQNNESFIDEETISEDELDDASVDSVEKCAVCKSEPPDFIYDECSHYILCAACADTLVQQNNFKCVLCRVINTRIKKVFK